VGKPLVVDILQLLIKEKVQIIKTILYLEKKRVYLLPEKHIEINDK
jgi:hypothetical protein